MNNQNQGASIEAASRAEFEAEVRDLDLPADALARWPDGRYLQEPIESMWSGWQMARRTPAAQVGAGELPISSEKLEELAQKAGFIVNPVGQIVVPAPYCDARGYLTNFFDLAIEADRAQQAGAALDRQVLTDRITHLEGELNLARAELRAQLAAKGQERALQDAMTYGTGVMQGGKHIPYADFYATPASAQPASNVRQALENLCAALPDVLPQPAGDRYRASGKWAQGNSYAMRGHTGTVTYRADDMECVYAALDAANAVLLAHPIGAQPDQRESAAVPGPWRVLTEDDKPDASRLIDVILANGVCLMNREYSKVDWTQVADWRYAATFPAAQPAMGKQAEGANQGAEGEKA